MRYRATGYGLRISARGRAAAALLATIFLAACSGSLFESQLPAVTRYVIAPPAAAASATESAASHVDLAVGRPDVAPGLDTDRIAVLRGHELDYFRGAQWSGTLLDMTQAFLVTTMEDQKLFRNVAAEQARVAGEYLLDTEVRAFQAEYTGAAAPTVRVTIIGRVIRIRDRKIIETLSATATQPAAENRLTIVASAFEAAMQRVSLEIAARTAASIAADKAKQPAAEAGT